MSENAGITCSRLLVSRGNFLVSIATHCQAPALAGLMGGEAEEKGVEDGRCSQQCYTTGRDETDMVAPICTMEMGQDPA